MTVQTLTVEDIVKRRNVAGQLTVIQEYVTKLQLHVPVALNSMEKTVR